jgi:DNA polymerase-3 subunit gamma/tau
MSYLVFARKWRPLTFDDVVGQEHITSTLKRAIEKKRVAHAFIFTGTRGVGKTTTARIMARALNCDKGPTPTPCGECESCKNIIRGSSFDVIEIDGASNNGVDNIRELRENVSYTSMGGKYRIFVIDEVHMLTKGAFNALLKTLEEPPANVIFIFATTEPQKIPETIQSRCQRYDFRRISTEQIAGQLEKICTAEQIVFEKGAIRLIAQRGDGSMRDSLSLLDQVYSFCTSVITEKEVRDVLGLVDIEIYRDILDAVAEKNPGKALYTVEKVLERGFDLSEFVIGFQEYIRALLFSRLPGVLDEQNPALKTEYAHAYSEMASRFSEGDLLRIAEIARAMESDMRWSAFSRFAVETALVKIVYLENTVTIQQILSSLKSGTAAPALSETIAQSSPAGKKKNDLYLTGETATGPMPPPVVSIPLQQDPGEYDTPPQQQHRSIQDIATLWPEFIEKISEGKQNLGSFLSAGRIAGQTENSVDLLFAKQFGFQQLNAWMGIPIELHITQEKETETQPALTGKDITNPVVTHRASLEDDMENEPIIKSVLEIFDGQVL